MLHDQLDLIACILVSDGNGHSPREIGSEKNLFLQNVQHIQGAWVQQASGERHARVRTLGIAQRAIHLLPSLTCIQQPRARPGQGRARRYFNPFTAEEMPQFYVCTMTASRSCENCPVLDNPSLLRQLYPRSIRLRPRVEILMTQNLNYFLMIPVSSHTRAISIAIFVQSLTSVTFPWNPSFMATLDFNLPIPSTELNEISIFHDCFPMIGLELIFCSVLFSREQDFQVSFLLHRCWKIRLRDFSYARHVVIIGYDIILF